MKKATKALIKKHNKIRKKMSAYKSCDRYYDRMGCDCEYCVLLKKALAVQRLISYSDASARRKVKWIYA